MNYLMLVCADGIPAAVQDLAGAPDIGGWVREMDGRGIRLLGRALDPPQSAATVRVRDGATLVSDGPFAESKEFVAGFDVLECTDLDEAVKVAAGHPVAWSSMIELRPMCDGFELPDAGREWAASAPDDSWVLFKCLDGIPASDEVEASIEAGVRDWTERLRGRGTFVFGHPLARPATATTVRVRGGETVRSDGPFIETKEFIGGFAVLRDTSREEAIEIAAEHPLAHHHRIEVRRFASG